MNYIIRKTKFISYENFVDDETLTKAITRSLEIIGEATKNLSMNFREKHPDIEWRALTGLRDKLIHNYWGVNFERVWDVIENLIPEIEKKLKRILEDDKKLQNP
jgi:uncharacterized protein with HEPN domain